MTGPRAAGLGDALSLFHRALSAGSDEALLPLVSEVWPELPDREAMGDACLSFVRFEADDDVELAAAGQRLVREQLLARAPEETEPEQFLLLAAQEYVRATRYLVPTLVAFAHSTAVLAERDYAAHLSVFLRDGLFFLPALEPAAMSGRIVVDVLVHTRQRERAGLPIVRYPRQGRDGEGDTLDACKDLLVDTGIYGTLIHSMLTRGQLTPPYGIMFMISANPCIAGWLNFVLARRALREGLSTMSTIRSVIESIELFLKPFRFLPSEGAAARVEYADPLSIMCSLALARQIRLHAEAHATFDDDAGIDALTRATATAGDWYVSTPTPPLPGLAEFLRTWSLGLVPPLDRFVAPRLGP